MKIMKHDDYILQEMLDSDYNAYLLNLEEYSEVVYRKQILPVEGWAIPFVTGHKYKVHWGTGIDFTKMRYTLSNRWEGDDLPIYLDFNFTDVR
mmetsp:Transcript_43947/g.42517  ORF Transcript_43947/g.42517 Transcript_43947/m.42517 type:complete len:93 (-) Transcript_43947:422-700(-)